MFSALISAARGDHVQAAIDIGRPVSAAYVRRAIYVELGAGRIDTATQSLQQLMARHAETDGKPSDWRSSEGAAARLVAHAALRADDLARGCMAARLARLRCAQIGGAPRVAAIDALSRDAYS